MRRARDKAPFSLFSFLDIITSVMGIMILIILLMGLELVQQTASAPPQKTADISREMESASESLSQAIEDLKHRLQKNQAAALDLAGVDPRELEREVAELGELIRRLSSDQTQAERENTEAERRRKEAEAERIRRRNDSRTIAEMLEETQRLEEQLEKLKKNRRVIFNPAAGNAKQPWLVEVSGQGLTVAAVGRKERPTRFSELGAFRDWAGRRAPSSEYFVLLIKPSGAAIHHQVTTALQQLKFDVGYDLLSENQSAIDPETGAVPNE